MPGPEFGAALGEGLMATYGAIQQDRARKLQERRLDQAMQIAQLQNEIRLMTAHLAASSRENVANTTAGARRYAADAGYAAADRRAGATEYASDQSLAGRRYGADMGYAAADRRAGATEYASDNNLRGQRARAGATIHAADVGGKSRLEAARVAAGARDRATQGNVERGKMSLYGTMFKPKPQSALSDTQPPEPPKYEDWLKTQGFGSAFNDGSDDEPDDEQDEQDDMAAMDDNDDDQDEPTPPPAAATAPRQPATAPRAAVSGLPPMKPVASHEPTGMPSANPAAAAPSAKTVSSTQLDAFAKATNRTRQQAEKYAADHGWTIGQ